jgi:LuxR family maltose regulon positive regulatory protein
VLQRRASDWFVANGFTEEAFHYALAAHDFQKAAQIMEAQGLELLKRGALATILDGSNKLPEEVVDGRPRLNVILAWAFLLTGQSGGVEAYLWAAEKNRASLADGHELRGEMAAIRAYAAAQQGDVDRALEQADRALTLLPKEDFSVRSVVSFVLGGILYLQGEYSSAFEAMKEASHDGERSGNVHIAVSALSSMAGILMGAGKLGEAERTYVRALELGTSRGGQPLPMTASIYAGIARLHLARQDLPNARQFAQQGVELGAQWMNADSQISSLLALAQAAQLEGKSDEAAEALGQARQLAETHVLTPGTSALIEDVERQIQAHRMDSSPRGPLLDPLSERELEVLKLIARSRSNREIADELIVALGTVKAHTSAIYRKLDVRGRTAAVIKARELGLL